MMFMNIFALELQIGKEPHLGQRESLDADAMHNIHWYTLIPLDGPPGENDRSIPGAKSPEEALFSFERDLTSDLELCNNDDGTAEFLLEKRLRSLGVGPGELVEQFYVRRKQSG
jgi:hypothetical protein